jgi:hypothetical protein
MSSPSVARGRILAYRVFDAGDTIALDRVETKIESARRVLMGGPQVEGLVIPVRPIEIGFGECDVALAPLGRALHATVTAHVFDFGAVSFVYDVPIEDGTTLEALTPTCDALYDAPELTRLGAKHRAELLSRLGDTVENPHQWAEAETYTIVFAERIDGVASLAELARSEIVAKLLLGERGERALGAGVREDVLKNVFSYFTDDLVVADWNSALVVEPSGSRIVPFVLELATSQLLEFRYFDLLVDRELARVYDYVERSRPRVLRSPFGRHTRQVLQGYMEVTEFAERVDNAIKSVGDFWLARLYRASIQRFRVPEWREGVEAKLALVARAYEMLKGDVEVSRSQLLEIIIILLIAVELLAALRGSM